MITRALSDHIFRNIPRRFLGVERLELSPSQLGTTLPALPRKSECWNGLQDAGL